MSAICKAEERGSSTSASRGSGPSYLRDIWEGTFAIASLIAVVNNLKLIRDNHSTFVLHPAPFQRLITIDNLQSN